MDWYGSIFRGSALLSKNRELLKTMRFSTYQLLYQIGPKSGPVTNNMPRNKVSNNIDYIRKDPQPEKALKEPPLKPKLLSKYKPL